MNEDLIGKKLVAIRPMTPIEKADEGWDFGGEETAALGFEDGTVLFASRDYEGNGPGAIFGKNAKGEGFTLMPS